MLPIYGFIYVVLFRPWNGVVDERQREREKKKKEEDWNYFLLQSECGDSDAHTRNTPQETFFFFQKQQQQTTPIYIHTQNLSRLLSLFFFHTHTHTLLHKPHSFPLSKTKKKKRFYVYREGVWKGPHRKICCPPPFLSVHGFLLLFGEFHFGSAHMFFCWHTRFCFCVCICMFLYVQ